MNLYSFQDPVIGPAGRVRVPQDCLQYYLNDYDLPEVMDLAIGETHIDDDGFAWRRDA